MKLVIEIPEEVKQAFDCAESNDLKAGYYGLGGVIGAAIKNGKPLDTVLDEIRAEIKQVVAEESAEDLKWTLGLKYSIKIIDKYKAESEE